MQSKIPFILTARDSLPHMNITAFKEICEKLGYALNIEPVNIDGKVIFKGAIYSGNILITQSIHEEEFIDQHRKIVDYIHSYYITGDNEEPVFFFG